MLGIAAQIHKRMNELKQVCVASIQVKREVSIHANPHLRLFVLFSIMNAMMRIVYVRCEYKNIRSKYANNINQPEKVESKSNNNNVYRPNVFNIV